MKNRQHIRTSEDLERSEEAFAEQEKELATLRAKVEVLQGAYDTAKAQLFASAKTQTMKKETAIGIASLLSDAQEWISRKETAKANDLINQAKEQLFESAQKERDLSKLLFSQLDADVHPWEWISAMFADYKTLREKAAAAGIKSDDPTAENEMLAHVGRFCEGAAALTYAANVVTCQNCGAENPGVYEFLNCLKCGREGPDTFTPSTGAAALDYSKE